MGKQSFTLGETNGGAVYENGTTEKFSKFEIADDGTKVSVIQNGSNGNVDHPTETDKEEGPKPKEMVGVFEVVGSNEIL